MRLPSACRCCPALASLLLLAFATNANAIIFDDGMVHIIDAANTFPNDMIEVLDGPGSTTTTVTVVDGGQVGTLPLDVFGSPTRNPGIDGKGNSVVNVSGGEVSSVFLFDSAVGTITGGRTICGLRLNNNAEATISGGNMGSKCFGPTIQVEDNSKLTITDGIIQRAFIASGDSIVDITGGIFGEPDQDDCTPRANDNSVITISGGEWGFDTPTRCTFAASGSAARLIVVGSGFNHPLGDLTGPLALIRHCGTG